MLTILLIAALIVWIIFFTDAVIGFRNLDRLEEEPPIKHGPELTIIVAARNEEQHIQRSVMSQLEQTYQNIEWILVNDRSNDDTGTIMENIKNLDSRINVIHIEQLPQGWLGKNHALYRGAQVASGKWLLFTDADVHFKNNMIAKAISYAERLKLDHLTAAPNLNGRGIWLQSFVAFFLFGFSYFKRPWTANNPRSKNGTGIGAFMLVSKSAYVAFGTHEVIKLRPDDDLQLGMRMKKAGFKCRIVTALHLLEVEWYPNLKEAFIGLEKNTFAGLHYRMSMVMFAIVGTFISQVLPFFTVFSTNQPLQLISLANIALIAFFYTYIIKRMTRFSPVLFLLFPLTAILFIYSIIRASFLTFKRGGIIWRGTKYKLSDLRGRK
ncbi:MULTISPECIES: glycosyltransferase family 2 protein [unclassified Bacillus (in: firmicutes)]|uniref:glycosyltransferase n=1 Tax=unclassified Bacillus (in: firmicutes) TaxID=185979 RepID=UPI0008E18603|nr:MULTISPECIES: glycosyltransferase family 2 protein [unclassified Bacillus (in: firmicutes)]SFA97354.1 Glycosyltransferase, catalytic subunit of cellulose synthase and poly-beta-1,6-N-acetylglucosamine synthase [Bacillus sp. UNCCL13]SFQ80455.1 Glycosyltransferase, catalytic subunit of cellulose synthase and poly-beta-1,6-N-acetylglucosamine synthase [Bacillus sp. cl95]